MTDWGRFGMWIGVGLAVSVGIFITKDPACLYAFVIPLAVELF